MKPSNFPGRKQRRQRNALNRLLASYRFRTAEAGTANYVNVMAEVGALNRALAVTLQSWPVGRKP